MTLFCPKCRLPIGGNEKWITSYWGNCKLPYHEVCLPTKAETEESKRLCKEIDSDCNDCRHFSRGEWLSKGVCSGRCTKFDKPTEARPNFYSGKECFEMRT